MFLIVSDVRDRFTNARRATRGKIRTGSWLNYEKKSAEHRYYNGETAGGIGTVTLDG